MQENRKDAEMHQMQLRQAIERELHDNLLPFWRERALDSEKGGFIAEMSLGGLVNETAAKGLILNARLLWTFSALYREFQDRRDLALARRAYDFIESRFHDRQCGGYFWRTTADGRPLDVSKKTYGQAFCIYALSEYHRATGAPEALHEVQELCRLIERRAHDDRRLGYIEALSRDWSPTPDQRLSDKDMDAAKSMNNHLHILEAYANLYRVWPDQLPAARLRELIELFGSRMLTSTGHFDLFFDQGWRVRSDSYTYGHDIEGAWLLCDAAESLGDDALREQTARWAMEIARAVAAEGLDQEGGLAYEGRGGAVIDSGREWWPQAEAILGFWCAYRISGEERYAEIAGRLWDFIECRMVDRVQGEWFWRVFADGSVDQREPKVSEWKDPYHAVRMCLKMLGYLESSRD